MPSTKPTYELQNDFITKVNSPAIIFGYAGTGKTYALFNKYLELIKNNVSPEEILFVTLKNNAALEIKKQIKKILGSKSNIIHVGTYNYLLTKILRNHSDKVGLQPNFTIYDTEDSQNTILNILAQLKLSDEDYDVEKLQKQFRYIKNQFIKPEDYKFSDKDKFQNNIIKIFYEYQNRLRFNNAVDFEDIGILTLELFQTKAIAQQYKKSFKYIFFDDFQDITPAQLEIAKLLYNKNFFISYDENQVINEWRGNIANIKNEIINLFPKIQVYEFNQNVRNNDLILNSALSVLPGQSSISYTPKENEQKIISIKCFDEKDEAYQICKRINEIINEEKLTYKDFAVLYRIHSQARIYDEYFKYEKVPTQIIRKLDLFKYKEIKDIIGYLKVISNPNDEQALLRIMNFPQRGIGATSIEKMIIFARKLNISLFETMGRVYEVIDIRERIQKNIKNFKLLLDKYISLRDKLSIYELTSSLLDEIKIFEVLDEENTLEAANKKENIKSFLEFIQAYRKQKSDLNLIGFLNSIMLKNGFDFIDESVNAVKVIDIHSAKNVEFPVIFITGLEEDLFPINPKYEENTTEDEEARLLYMGMTRATKRVFLTYARSRYRFGEVAYQGKSKLIDKIIPTCIKEEVGSVTRRTVDKKIDLDELFKTDEGLLKPDSKKIKIGTRLIHQVFGYGKITEVIGGGQKQKIVVAFEDGATKQIMVSMAKMKAL